MNDRFVFQKYCLFVFGFDCFSTWIMVGCWKDLGFGQISLRYNFPIVQNFVFLMFKWENVKRVCITHTFDRIVIFHMSWEFRLIQGFYWFYRYCIVCAHFIIIKYIVWYRNKPVVLLKQLKTDLCRSNFDFHQNLQKHKWNFLKIKYVLDRYTSNNFLKYRLYVQIPMSWSRNYC